MKLTMAALVCSASFASVVQSQSPAPLHLVQTLTMEKGVTGRFDHMAVDIQGGRLFLTAADHHSIQIFDLKSGKWMRSVTGLGKPAGTISSLPFGVGQKLMAYGSMPVLRFGTVTNCPGFDPQAAGVAR